MTKFNTTHLNFVVAAVASVLILGSTTMMSSAAAAEPTLDGAEKYLTDLEEARVAVLGAEDADIRLTGSAICTSDGGSGCKILSVVDSAMADAVDAAGSQGSGLEIDQRIESMELPRNIRSGLEAAVNEDLTGEASGANSVTLSIEDETDFVAVMAMLDFAIESAKANVDRLAN